MSRRTRRATREVQTPEYIKFVKRTIRAAGRRVAAESEADLADLIGLQADLDQALAVAVTGLRQQGHAWSYIAAGLGMSPQAARKRFGVLTAVAG